MKNGSHLHFCVPEVKHRFGIGVSHFPFFKKMFLEMCIKREQSSHSRQCTATADCSEAEEGSASPGAAGLLCPVAVCGEVGLRD